jgi:ABC-type branched-subunit amino acid transport system permease subunit
VDAYLIAALLSLGAGALYASLAQGLLLSYRSSGVINFAHGAMALYGAYVFSELRATGRWVVLPLPNPLVLVEGILDKLGADITVPHWPTFVDLGGGQSVWVAMALTAVTGGGLGLLMYLLIFRPMRGSPPLAKVVASVGVMIILQAVVVLRFGTDPRQVPKILPTNVVEPFGVRIPIDRFYLAAIAIVLALVLAAVYRFSRFGWATEASAENEKGAILTGLSPEFLAAVNWTAAAVIAVVMGALFSTITALSPDNFILFVLPALAAMLLGGLRSFVGATLAAFGIAALQQIAVPLSRDVSWLPRVGLADGLPLLIIIIVMVVRGSRIPTRDSSVTEALPAAPEPKRGWQALVIVGGLALLGVVFFPYDYRTALINSAICVVLALSLVVIVGLVGQISLMQTAIAGLAAVAMTRLAGDWGVPFPFAPLLAAATAMVLSLLAAMPALRLRGTYLALVTLGGALAFNAMVLENRSILPVDEANVPAPSIFGFRFGVNDTFSIGQKGAPNPAFGIFAVLMAILACYLYCNVRKSAVGRHFLAVRSNERAAAAAGIGVSNTKILAFAISGFLAGLAGALASYQFESVSAPTFGALTSLTVLAFVYLAGVGSMAGAITAGIITIGGLSYRITDDLFHVPKYQLLVGGVGLTIAAVRHPEGISGEFSHIGAAVKRRFTKEVPAAPPPEVAAEEPIRVSERVGV